MVRFVSTMWRLPTKHFALRIEILADIELVSESVNPEAMSHLQGHPGASLTPVSPTGPSCEFRPERGPKICYTNQPFPRYFISRVVPSQECLRILTRRPE
jgi:hypothetical protein